MPIHQPIASYPSGRDGIIEAERKGHQQANGDRHIQVGAAVAERLPRGQPEQIGLMAQCHEGRDLVVVKDLQSASEAAT